MKIILITGKRGAGKDKFASGNGLFVLRRKGNGTTNIPDRTQHNQIVKFATPLRNLITTFFLLPPHLDQQYEKIKDDPTAIPYKGTLRDYFISIAEVVREKDCDFFVKALYQSLLEYHDTDSVFWCTDWRYPNELDFLKNKGVEIITIRIIRHNNPMTEIDHQSETSLDDYVCQFDFESIC